MQRQKQPTKRQLQHMATLEAIRAAVDKLVMEMGFENMRIQDICEEVGISSGAFYHYFSSKNDVFRDRYKRRNMRYRNMYEERLKQMPPVDALKFFMAELLQYTHTRIHEVLRNYSKALIDEYARWYEDDGDAVPEVISHLVENGQNDGLLTTEYQPAEIAMMLNDYYRGIMVSESVCPGSDDEYLARQKILFNWLESLLA